MGEGLASLFDCEEDRTLRAVVVDTLLDMERR